MRDYNELELTNFIKETKRNREYLELFKNESGFWSSISKFASWKKR